MTLALRYAVRSDVGLLREGNEDSAYAGPRLLAVADGMGGHAAGEVASAVAISALAHLDDDVPGTDLIDALGRAVRDANKTLHEMVVANPALDGMGTTLTAMLWSGPRVALCHIGDSRAYLLREGELYQITHDHTLVQKLQDEGRISPDEAATHPQRSLILRALDGRSEAEPDVSLREAKMRRPLPAVFGRALRRGERGDAAPHAEHDHRTRPGRDPVRGARQPGRGP